MNSRLVFAARVMISLALVVFFAVWVDLGRVFRPIPSDGWLYLLAMALLANLDRVVMSYKWNILLKVKDIRLPLSEVVRSYYVGTFWGVFLPTSVGGDLIRTYGIAGRTRRAKDIVSSVVLERALGILSTLFVANLSIALAALVHLGEWKAAAVGLIVPFVLFVVVLVVSFDASLSGRLAQRFGRPEGGWVSKVARVYDSYQAYKHHRGVMLRFCLWSVVEQCFPVLCVFLVARALHTEVPFLYFVIFVPIIMAFSKLPISLDGFGVREGLYVYCFAMVGLSGPEAFRIGLVSHVLAIAAVLPGFLYCSLRLLPAASGTGRGAEDNPRSIVL